MKKRITIGILLLTFIMSCNKIDENQVVVKREKYDSLLDEISKYRQTIESSNVEENDINGQYQVYSVDSKHQEIKKASSFYTVKIDYLSNYGIVPRNYLNEGSEWFLYGELRSSTVILSGDNINKEKRIGGSLELINGSKDSLYVETTIRLNNSNDCSDLVKNTKEIWIKKSNRVDNSAAK